MAKESIEIDPIEYLADVLDARLPTKEESVPLALANELLAVMADNSLSWIEKHQTLTASGFFTNVDIEKRNIKDLSPLAIYNNETVFHYYASILAILI